jgi:transposase-like protein
MATAREIRSLIEQTTTGTRRRRVPEEVKAQVRRYAARRRAQGSSWEAIGRETGLEARKLRAWYRKARELIPVPALRPVAVVAEPEPATGLVVVAPSGLRVEGLGVQEAAQLVRPLR